MLIGQDWASSKWLSNPKNLSFAALGKDPNLMTNRNLDEYLNYFGLNFSDTFATNAFVFVKEGNMSAKIAKKLLSRPAKPAGYIDPRTRGLGGCFSTVTVRIDGQGPRIHLWMQKKNSIFGGFSFA
jgi:hypothetical protein